MLVQLFFLAVLCNVLVCLAVKAWAGSEFWTAIGQTASAFSELTLGSALHNIVIATIGNLAGGSLIVGAVYWFVYLRRRT